jgi:hypothetical protein
MWPERLEKLKKVNYLIGIEFPIAELKFIIIITIILHTQAYNGSFVQIVLIISFKSIVVICMLRVSEVRTRYIRRCVTSIRCSSSALALALNSVHLWKLYMVYHRHFLVRCPCVGCTSAATAVCK